MELWMIDSMIIICFHLYSKNFFNNVQKTVLIAKQYKFFYRLRYLLRWLVGISACTFYVLKLIWFTWQGHWNFGTLLLKDIQNSNATLLYFNMVHPNSSLAETFPDWRKIFRFFKIIGFQMWYWHIAFTAKFFTKWMTISIRVN